MWSLRRAWWIAIVAASACSQPSEAARGGRADAASGAKQPTAVGDSWTRPLLTEPGARPFLLYAVFGEFSGAPKVSRSQHRSNGVPAGAALTLLTRGENDDALTTLCSGPMWEQLQHEQPELANSIAAAPTCAVLRGEIENASDLVYLRDALGVITALLEQGGLAVYDAQAWLWFDAPTWRREYFEHDESRPRRHVQILMSDESTPGRAWFHSRGMRKFGRPDLSVHCVSKELAPAVIEMLDRFVVMGASGAIVDEGHAISMSNVPAGGRCTLAGSLDDPDFNNEHIELVWPEGSELSCPE